MLRTRIACLVTALACLAGLCAGVSALEVDCDTTYCFSQEDFAPEEQLAGICIMELPDANTGTIMLGSRVLRPGDILTAEQLEQMTFLPLKSQQDVDAVVTYLPIYENRVAPETTMTISVRGKEDKAPVAEDFAIETYKNLPNEARLKVTDPEGKKLTYTVTKQPKRGQVQVMEDGTFVYTPKKNKVGEDSFTYTATDPAGNVSREAKVSVKIMKTSAQQYSDTAGKEYRFAAEWMKNTGLFVGEQVGGEYCFNGHKTVTRGEFLAMMLQVLQIPVDDQATFVGFADEIPAWLKPYLAAALRSGVTAGLPSAETGIFGAEEGITGGEAAVMLQNGLDLAVTTSSMEDVDGIVPEWAQLAVTAMSENGIHMEPMDVLTRGQVALILYQVSQMAQDAPGLQMYQ
jgi:hypothetical protein